MTITYLSMNEAPNHVSGGFNVAPTLYSVSKRGVLTLLAEASDCTYQGDQMVTHTVDKRIPRIAIKTVRSGNGGWEQTTYYKVGA